MSRPSSLTRGDVLLSGNRPAVVWSSDASRLTPLPVMNSGGVIYRGDVPVSKFRDMVAIGMGGLDLPVRCAKASRVARRGQTQIGRLSDELRSRVADAVTRECATASVERRWKSASRTSAAYELM